MWQEAGAGNAINLSSYCPSLERVKGEEIKNMLKLMAFNYEHLMNYRG